MEGSIERATHIDGDIAELRPAHGMVHVVFAKVVFGQVGDVGLLDMGNVARSQHADVHVCGMSVCY